MNTQAIETIINIVFSLLQIALVIGIPILFVFPIYRLIKTGLNRRYELERYKAETERMRAEVEAARATGDANPGRTDGT